MSKILVFGGSGFFAKSFYGTLETMSHDTNVVSISRSVKNTLPGFIKELSADVTRFDTLASLPDIFDGARCVYLADPSSDKIPSDKVRYKNMLLSIKNVAKFCRQRGIQDVTYASSGAVYECSDQIKSEQSDLKKYNEKNYASAKIISESYIQDFAGSNEINCKVARCFSFVGGCLPNTHFAIMNFINDVVFGREIRISGSGLEVRSYLHQLELGKALTNLVLYDKPLIVNIGSSRPVRLLDLAHKIASTYNVSVIGPLNAGAYDENVYVPSTDKYRALFGSLETLSLAKRIDRTYQVLRKHHAL